MQDAPIVQVTIQRGAHSLVRYKGREARNVSRRTIFVRIEDVFGHQEWKRGIYPFTSLDGMTKEQLVAAKWLWSRLSERPDAFAPLNKPGKVIGRFELLRRLHQVGANEFNVHRVLGLPRDVRLPAFVRYENLHRGNLTALLDTRSQLDDAIARLLAKGERAEDLIVTEFLDYKDDDGVYRKYGAHIVGERLVPKHLMAGRHWMLKMKTTERRCVGGDELRFVTESPHRALLEPVFAMSGHTWGRIDYSIYKGRLQVWEINDNPEMGTKWKRDLGRRPVHRVFFPQFERALDEVSGQIVQGDPLNLCISAREVLGGS